MRRIAVRVCVGMLVAVLPTLLLGVLTVGPARAEDPLPLPLVPNGATPPAGLVPPSGDDRSDDPAGSPGSFRTDLPGATTSVSPPSQKQIEDAREALDRLKNGGATPTAQVEVAAPTTSGSVASRLSDQAWWTMAAALLVLLVASEATRIGVRRAKHRREA